MYKTGWVLVRAVAVVGIGIVLDGFLPTLTPNAQAESLNVKPGAWELTVTTVTSGMKLSPEMSANMTPAQQAQMERMMKAREGKPHTMTAPSCITKEDISYDRIIKEMEDEDEDAAVKCKIKVISKSSSKLVLDQLCPGPPASTTHFTIDAKTPESFTAVGEREQHKSGKAHMEIKGKWVGAGCEDIND